MLRIIKIELSMGKYSIEAKIGIAAVILFALISNWNLVKQEGKFDPKQIGRDNISLYDKRFDGLRKILPSHGIVGYISDRPITDYSKMADAALIAQYYLVQYAVAPVLVDDSIERKLVIGNFHQPNVSLPKEKKFTVLKDFGNGVVLFETEKAE